MTQEEKAKAYDEALEQAKKELNTCGSMDCDAARQIFRFFPELRESEDERIRKRLLWFLANYTGRWDYPETRMACRAWLEKQKEPHYTKRNALFDKCVENCDPATMKRVSDEIDEMLRKEQKPVVTHGETYHVDTLGTQQVIAGKMPQKPAEKQDYSGLNDLERAILRGFLAAGMDNFPATVIKETAKECLAQMKPAEWSEEDEKIITRLIGYFESFRIAGVATKWEGLDIQEVITLLKSLRNRPKSSDNWKPSEEQMAALYTAAREAPIIKENGNYLYDLYDQLKKLNDDNER